MKKRYERWNLTNFLSSAKEIHNIKTISHDGLIKIELKYDYSHVTKEHIKNKNSRVPVICNTCFDRWSPSIQGHINAKTGCPQCAGNVPWTLERFLKAAEKIHGKDLFDYSQVTDEYIINANSHIPIRCFKCNYEWSPTIHNHINHKTKCLNCDDRVPLTIKSFLEAAEKIHGKDLFDYSQIKSKHINGNKSHIPLKCNKCNYEWSPTIHNHINNKSGCPKCNSSKLEKMSLQCFEELNIKNNP
jgi:formylmethanofuran dehydrogenase subunit E